MAKHGQHHLPNNTEWLKFRRLTVHSKNKEITHIKVFNKKTTKNIYIDGDISIQEPERYIALINDKDWMVIQANTFLKVIKKLSNLRK